MLDEEMWFEINRIETTGGLEIIYENLITGDKETKYYPIYSKDSKTSKGEL